MTKTCSCNHPPASPQRRRFFGVLGALAGVFLLPGQAWAKKIAVGLNKIPALKKVGGWTIVKLKGKELLLIRDGKTSVRAFDSLCTHQGHRLKYIHRSKKIQCPNHGSHFDLQGKVLKGPARKNLAPSLWTRLDVAKQRLIIKLS